MQGKEMNTTCICRLCLGENAQLIHVSESKGIPGWTAAIAINELLRIEISEGDIYPKFICTECMGKLVDFKLFKHQCEINKDSLDFEYRRNREVGVNEGNVVGMVLCANERQTEICVDGGDRVPVERDPLEESSEEEEEGGGGEITTMKAEMEESPLQNGNNEVSCAEVIGSVDEVVSYQIKSELEEQEVNGPSENIVYCDRSVKEELEDITTESCSNGRAFEGSTQRVSVTKLIESVNINTGFSRELRGCSYMSCILPDAQTIRPQNDSKGFTSVSCSSRVEDITGNEYEVPKSNSMSSHTHMSSHDVPRDIESGPEPIMLSQCPDEYSIVSRFQNQEKIQDVGKVFKCVICFEKFATSDHLRRHILIHCGGEKLFQQAECSKTTTRRQQSNINSQMKIHSEEGIFKCIYCSETFSHKRALNAHLFRSGDRLFMCDRCGTTFLCKSKHKAHILTHSSDKPFHCPLCCKGFRRKDKLKLHMSVHSEDKPYSCDVCSRSFSRRDNLNKHIKFHSGERPYQCIHCSKFFTTSSTLFIHMMIHSGVRPHKCGQCGKSFCTNSDLTKHSRVHSGERPYQCDQCRKCFSLNGNLRKHMRIHSRNRTCEHK